MNGCLCNGIWRLFCVILLTTERRLRSARFIQSTQNGMDAHELARSVLTILKSDSNTIDLQIPLFELLGPESFDFIQLVRMYPIFSIASSLIASVSHSCSINALRFWNRCMRQNRRRRAKHRVVGQCRRLARSLFAPPTSCWSKN